MKFRIFILSFIFIFLSFIPVFAAYQPPAGEIILFVDEEGGIKKEISNMSRVPLFCLYKDGRLLYSATAADGVIYLMETKLDEEGIDKIKSFFASSDEWNDVYDNSPLKDMPIVTFTANIDGAIRKYSVRGIDYAMKQKTIPKDLSALYRYIAFFSDDNSKEYESDEIFIYVKSVDQPDKNTVSRTLSWRSKVDLAALVEESGISGISVAKLSGKQAKGVLRILKYKVPFMTADLPVFVKQKRNYYSMAFRPLMPHEIKDSGEDKK